MSECVISGYAKNSAGYGLVPAPGGGGHIRHHRLAYCKANNLSLEDIAGFVIRHTCDNPGCVNPEHLVIGTQAENMRDMAERVRGTVGERNKHAKLTAADVLAIRAAKATQAVLAKQYGVTQCTISSIQSRKSWAHI